MKLFKIFLLLAVVLDIVACSNDLETGKAEVTDFTISKMMLIHLLKSS